MMVHDPSIVGAVAAGHSDTANAAAEILQDGGNAIDAAAAMGFCLNLLEPFSNGIGGESPPLVYSA